MSLVAARYRAPGESVAWHEIEDDTMSAREFRDDDSGYRMWLDANPTGVVLNIARSHNPADAKLHLAACRTLTHQIRGGSAATKQYVKICAGQLAELEQWATANGIALPPVCAACHRAPSAVRSGPVAPARRAIGAPLPDGGYTIGSPSAEDRAVRVWADDYIRFEHRPPWQEELRNVIRAQLAELEPSMAQVIHATFCGDKPGNADVENLLLYNLAALKVAAVNGIRFELGAEVPHTPDGIERPVYYRYALEPLSGRFDHWRPARSLASFDWCNLGASVEQTTAAHVWLALTLARPAVITQPIAPATPFAVNVHIRPPRGQEPRPDLRMKGILDGVIAAFQAHTDIAVLNDAADRLATVLPAASAEIARHLHDASRAVLGPVPQLVRPRGKAGVWNPGDHWCVAGELISEKPVDSCWAFRGEVIEVAGLLSRSDADGGSP